MSGANEAVVVFEGHGEVTVPVGTTVGPVPALKPPGRSTAFEPRMDAVPGVGEQTDAILKELGFDPTAIEAMRAAKAV